MKRSILIIFGLMSSLSWAISESEQTLLSAQIQYQNALKANEQTVFRLKKAREELDMAKAKFADAQNILQKAETEFQEATQARDQAKKELSDSGQKLDAAWGK